MNSDIKTQSYGNFQVITHPENVAVMDYKSYGDKVNPLTMGMISQLGLMMFETTLDGRRRLLGYYYDEEMDLFKVHGEEIVDILYYIEPFQPLTRTTEAVVSGLPMPITYRLMSEDGEIINVELVKLTYINL